MKYPRLQPGDRVRYVGHNRNWVKDGVTGVIIEDALDDSNDSKGYRKVSIKLSNRVHVCRLERYKLEVIDVPINPSRVRSTRSGLPVANVEKTDGDRPLRAEVFVDRQWLTLTFAASGHFYGHVDQPIDLVEAK